MIIVTWDVSDEGRDLIELGGYFLSPVIVDLVLGAGDGQPDVVGDGAGERVVDQHQEGPGRLRDLALRDVQCRAVSLREIQL